MGLPRRTFSKSDSTEIIQKREQHIYDAKWLMADMPAAAIVAQLIVSYTNTMMDSKEFRLGHSLGWPQTLFLAGQSIRNAKPKSARTPNPRLRAMPQGGARK